MFVTLATAMSLVININKFSLHSIYRNRLIRAYLGASRLPEYQEERRPNPFTGFDPNDNIQLHQLAPPNQPIKKPFHIVNIAINSSPRTESGLATAESAVVYGVTAFLRKLESGLSPREELRGQWTAP